MAGKGDKPRPMNKEKFYKNFDRIFNEQKIIAGNKKPLQKQKTNKKGISK